MTEVKRLRRQAGLTQQQLASLAGTSQSTIAAYECGRKSPTLCTLHRLAHAAGLEVHCVFVAPMTREDRRGLAYHQAIADRLSRDPGIVERARRTLALQKQQHPHAGKLLAIWETWLDLPVQELIAQMMSPDLLARDMRQVSPFAGILTPAERLQILKIFAQAEAA